MDLNFCTICYQETNGDLYCSSSCRQADTPSASPSASLSTASSPPLFSLTQRKSSPTAPRSSPFFRSFSGSSEEDEDSEDFFSTDFQLPNKRNIAHIRAAGAMPSRGARPLPREGNIAARGGGARFGGAAGGGVVAGVNDDDIETEMLMALTKPLSLEHRHKSEGKFAGRAKYPAAF